MALVQGSDSMMQASIPGVVAAAGGSGVSFGPSGPCVPGTTVAAAPFKFVAPSNHAASDLDALPTPPAADTVQHYVCPACTFKAALGVDGPPRVCEICGANIGNTVQAQRPLGLVTVSPVGSPTPGRRTLRTPGRRGPGVVATALSTGSPVHRATAASGSVPVRPQAQALTVLGTVTGTTKGTSSAGHGDGGEALANTNANANANANVKPRDADPILVTVHNPLQNGLGRGQSKLAVPSGGGANSKDKALTSPPVAPVPLELKSRHGCGSCRWAVLGLAWYGGSLLLWRSQSYTPGPH